jgi:hypothetical protein
MTSLILPDAETAMGVSTAQRGPPGWAAGSTWPRRVLPSSTWPEREHDPGNILRDFEEYSTGRDNDQDLQSYDVMT